MAAGIKQLIFVFVFVHINLLSFCRCRRAQFYAERLLHCLCPALARKNSEPAGGLPPAQSARDNGWRTGLWGRPPAVTQRYRTKKRKPTLRPNYRPQYGRQVNLYAASGAGRDFGSNWQLIISSRRPAKSRCSMVCKRSPALSSFSSSSFSSVVLKRSLFARVCRRSSAPPANGKLRFDFGPGSQRTGTHRH